MKKKAAAPVRKRRTESMKQRAFLAAFAKCGSIHRAAKAAKCCRQQHSVWMVNPTYAEQFAVAAQEALELLEEEARRRAEKGCRRTIWYKGRKVGTEIEYSDRLMEFLLAALAPTKYGRQQKLELSGQVEIIERLAAGRRRLSEANGESRS